MELPTVTSLNVRIFSDRLSRPQLAILSWLLKTSKFFLWFVGWYFGGVSVFWKLSVCAVVLMTVTF